MLFRSLAVGLLVLASHGQTPNDKPKSSGEGQPVVAKSTVPEELEALNRATRQLYAGGRALELSKIPTVIIVSGDDLILRKNGKRVVAPVIPREYHALKCVAHSVIALANRTGPSLFGSRFPNTDIGRADQWQCNSENHIPNGVILAARPPQRNRLLRDEHILKDDRMRSGAAHPHRFPNAVDANSFGGHQDRKMQKDRKSTRLNSSHRSLSRMPSSA